VDDGYIAQAGKSRTHQMRNHLDPPHTVSVASTKPHQIRRSPCSGSLSIPRPTPFLKSICNFVCSFVFWFAAILPAFSRSFSDSPSFAYDFLKGIRPHPRAVACRFDGRGSRAPTLPDRSDPIRSEVYIACARRRCGLVRLYAPRTCVLSNFSSHSAVVFRHFGFGWSESAILRHEIQSFSNADNLSC
jgi:hypothetical protein